MIPSFTVEENMNLSSIDHYSKKGLFQRTDAVVTTEKHDKCLKDPPAPALPPARL